MAGRPNNANMRLLETTICEQATVDATAGVIRGVKILGRESSNGRVYSDRAMDSAARLYEGIGVNINHTDRSQPDRDRQLEEAFGFLSNVKREKDAVFGDLHFLKSHPLAAVVIEAAERMPNQLGLSHHAEGKVVREGGRAVVEDVEKVFSVDLVRNPATNRGLFESKEGTMKKKVKTILAESYPKKYKSIAKLLREMDGPEDEPMANMEVDVPAEGGAEEQAKAAFESMVLAVLHDESLDKAGKLSKIKEILAAEEKLLGTETTEEEEDEPGQEKEDKEEKEATESKRRKPATDPAVKQLMEQVSRLNHRQLVRDILEESGYRYADLSPERKKLLAKLDDEEAIRDLIESWGPPALNGHSFGGRRTVISESTDTKPAADAKSFAKLVKSR